MVALGEEQVVVEEEVSAEEPEEADRVGRDPDQDRRLCRLAAVTKDLRDNPTSPSGKYDYSLTITKDRTRH